MWEYRRQLWCTRSEGLVGSPAAATLQRTPHITLLGVSAKFIDSLR